MTTIVPLEIRFMVEFERLSRTSLVIQLELDPPQAWALMAQLQLACRHPDNHGPDRDVAEQVARAIQADLAVSPALKQVAEMGWQPECDRILNTPGGIL